MTFTVELVTATASAAGLTTATRSFDASMPTDVKFDCTAIDYNLDEAKTCETVAPSVYPNFTADDFTLTTYESINQWYANTFSGQSRLYQIEASRTDSLEPLNTLSVQSCDAYNHCAIEMIDDTDGDGIPDTVESTGDRDGDGVIDMFDYDPAGHFYEVGSGRVITDGQILVSGTGRVTITADGATGFYDWYTDGTPGRYAITAIPPAGYALSPDCPPQPQALVPTGDEPLFLGASELAGTRHLADGSCAGNPYYLGFEIARGDPFVFNNNIPLIAQGGETNEQIFLPLISNAANATLPPAPNTVDVGLTEGGETVTQGITTQEESTGPATGANLVQQLLLPLVANE